MSRKVIQITVGIALVLLIGVVVARIVVTKQSPFAELVPQTTTQPQPPVVQQPSPQQTPSNIQPPSQPSRDSRCELKPMPGPCEARIDGYYFNKAKNACDSFSWGGCGGVLPFGTLGGCIAACEDVSIDWKSYADPSNSFTFRYPSFLESLGFPWEYPGTRTVEFNNPKAGKKVVFVVSVFYDKRLLYESYGSDWKYHSDTIVGGSPARKLFRAAIPGDIETDMTAYLIASKSVAVTFNSSKFHQVPLEDLDKILSTFRFLQVY